MTEIMTPLPLLSTARESRTLGKIDLNYTFRLLQKNLAFNLLTTAIMTLGLVICLYMSSFIYSINDKPLPYIDGDRIALLGTTLQGKREGSVTLVQDLEVIKKRATFFESIGGFQAVGVNLSLDSGTTRESAVFTDPNAFELSQTEAFLGRLFNSNEAISGSSSVAVISYEYWQSFFSGSSEIIGKSVKINGRETEIIGVLPEGHMFPWQANIYKPLIVNLDTLKREDFFAVGAYTKLKEDVSLASANAELKHIMKDLEVQFPKINTGVGAYVETYPKFILGHNADSIILLMYTVFLFILFLFLVNVGNLLTTKVKERAHEIAIRMSIGATRQNIIVQMMLEGLIICLVSLILALFIVSELLNLTNTIAQNLNSDFFIWSFAFGTNTLLVAIGIFLVSVFFTGFIPAWKASNENFHDVLREGTVASRSKAANRIDSSLITAQVTMSITILSVSLLVTIFAFKASNFKYGVDTNNVMTAVMSVPARFGGDTAQELNYFAELADAVTQSPSVNDVAIMAELPGERASWPTQYAVEGIEYQEKANYPRATPRQVTPGALEALDIQLVAGRYFENHDMQDRHNILISESMAKLYWPNESALGKRLRIVESSKPEQWLTVVGVFENLIYGKPYDEANNLPVIFYVNPVWSVNSMTIALKHNGNVRAAIEALQQYVSRTTPEVAIYSISNYQDKLNSGTALLHIGGRIFLLFAIISLILSAIGIYGFVSNTVVQRTKEIAIRRSLGATNRKIFSFFFSQRLWQLSIAAICGVLISLVFVFTVGNLSRISFLVLAVIYVVVIASITLMALLATYIPVQKALRREPNEVLKYE